MIFGAFASHFGPLDSMEKGWNFFPDLVLNVENPVVWYGRIQRGRRQAIREQIGKIILIRLTPRSRRSSSKRKSKSMKTQHARKAGFTLVEIMIVVAIIGLLATIAIPNFVRARLKAQQSACINNLRQIDGAKQQWALESKSGQSAVPVLANVQPYLGRGTLGTAPTCPADSAKTFETSYTLNDLSTAPACLILPGSPGDGIGHHLD
jgi:prepilin-type N-terminal cleavage/methylation domain-containing protein